MASFKDEIYIAWDNKADNIVNSLYNYFDGQPSVPIDVHIFLHQSKVKDHRVLTWPDNFIFHFTSTTSQNALQTALIAYVLEKFEHTSREIEFEDVTDKTKIFLIQESQSQFEELKSMLMRIPCIKNVFSFKLLTLSNSIDTEMLFIVTNGHNKKRNMETRASHYSRNSYDNAKLSPRLPKHGRRASEVPISECLQLSSIGRGFSLKSPKRTPTSPISRCKHCERMRGSQPKFNVFEKKFFCMACFLEGSGRDRCEGTDDDLCRRCLRSKEIELKDKSTDIPFHEFFRDFSIQCEIPVHEMRETSTSMPVMSTRGMSSQTDISMVNELNDDLQAKFFALLGEIDRAQNEFLNPSPVPSKIPVSTTVPKLQFDNQFAVSDDPFVLSKARKDPITNKFHCPFCQGSAFMRIEVFEVHLRNVHKKCNCSCEQYFQSREDYLEHFYSIFPLPCFELRKCPERFRSIPYQAIHHAKVHLSEKPYYCCVCYDVQQKTKMRFKSIRALQIHAKEMGHYEEDLFLRVVKSNENDNIPLTGRTSALNFSGDF